MQVGLVLGGALFVALGIWWIVLWVKGVRTPPSGIDGSGGDPNVQ